MNNGFAGAWASVIAGGVLLACVPAAAGAGNLILLSSTTYNNSGASAQAYGITIDSDNVIVTGYVEQAGRRDVLAVKYDPELSRVLSFVTFSAGGNARGNAVTTDSQGNVIVAGLCQGDGLDALILKYSPDFSQLISSAVYASSGTASDTANGVAVDDEDNILVAGASSDGASTRWLVLCYDPGLAALVSSATVAAGNSAAYAVAADTAGSVYVTGQAGADFLTVRYDAALQFVSSMTYNGAGNGDDAAYGMFIDDEGSVWVTGESFDGAVQCRTLKYDAGLTRELASVAGPAGTRGRVLDREPEGALIVAGRIDVPPGGGYVVRYSSDLARVVSSATVQGMPGGGEVRGLVVNSSGSIIAAGYAERGVNDFAFFAQRYNGMPAVWYVSPETVDLGYEGDLEIEGDNLYPGASLLLSGTGITVSSYTVERSPEGFFMVRASVTVAWDAPLGPRDASLTNIDGAAHTMPSAFAVVKGSPTVAFVSPEAVDRGYEGDMEIEGNNFDPRASLLFSGTGVTISSYAVVSSTMMTAYIAVSWEAPLGPRDVSVMNLDGLTDTTTGAFTVEKGSPVVSYVWPEVLEQGTSDDLEISGNNFDPGAAIFLSGTGITISSYAVVCSTFATAYVFIDSAAPLGPRDVSILNTDGLSDAMPSAVTVVKHFPVVSYVWPETGERGAALDLEISGGYFQPGASLLMSGEGIAVSSYAVACSTMITAHIVVAWDAPLGPRDVSVYNVDGGSDTMPGAFTLQGGLTIDLDYDTTVYYWVNGREIKLEIPADTFDDMVTLLISSMAPAPGGGGRLRHSLFCVDISNNLNLPPHKTFTMTVAYKDGDVAGLDEAKLALALYDPALGAWFPLASTVYPAQNRLAARVSHLSLFAIVQLLPAQTLEGIKAFPNPFNPGRGVLVLDNLTAEPARIQVFTVAGERVRSIEYGDGSGRAVWDGRNDGGSTVGSGVYLVLIKGSGAARILKVAVER